MMIMKRIWKIWNELLNLFYPNVCLLCRKPLIEGEEQICLHCLCNLPRTRFHLQKENPVEQLFIGKITVLHASSFLYYEKGSPVQQLIHSLKYYDNKELAYLLGRLYARELQKANSPLCQADYLIPVPLHPGKLRQRGYNQSERIAAGISSILHIPVEINVLSRHVQTESQTHKTVFDRWLNVKEIFSISGFIHLEGQHLLLIDDVITTGSTIAACAEALSSIPGVQISLLSIAVTKH